MSMTKEEVLAKYFSEKKGFRDVQEETIDSLLAGKNTLCLMPTGGGKSLIYQVAGLCMEKTTIIISPLIALMNQQNAEMRAKGISTVSFSGMDYKKQFALITDMANGVMPQYIFTSPERISSDGYLEYALNKRRDDIGLVVVDEAHCISQWGDGFRPAYRNIPDFLDRIFGRDGWPATLCLTATLNEEQQQQVIKDFHISNVVKGENLWRKNLYLEILNLKDGKEDTKDEELERIIEKHRGEKILVFAHRVYGKHPTTRTLYDKYKDVYEGVAYFDSKADDKYKAYVLEGFKNGDIKIVFATSAFGMGVDIPDIRVVVNYLISETVEQYYQEVGRGGRDNQPAYGYLLYTNQSKRGRRMLLNQSLCTEADLVSLYEDRKPKGDVAFGHVSYEDMNEEQRIAFALKRNKDIKVWNISLGSNQEINDNFISAEAAVLDQIQYENDVIFVVAGTNKSREDVNKIGSPADSINSMVVNAVTKSGLSTKYSRKGLALSFFAKPDVSYYGGSEEQYIQVCEPLGATFVAGTSFAAPWIARKLAYLIDVLGLNREIAKALIIDAARGWNDAPTPEEVALYGHGIVPIKITDIIQTPEDEIRFLVTDVSEKWNTYNYHFPIPLKADTYPYYARATMCYFPLCDRAQGVDYTNTELNLHFGRIQDDGKLNEINDDKQNLDDIGESRSYILEGDARERFRKWDNVKYVAEKVKDRRVPKKSYRNKNWGMEIKTNNRLDPEDGVGLRFGVVVTIKEMYGINRIDEFIKNCNLNGWLVNAIDIQNRIEIHEKINEEIRFD